MYLEMLEFVCGACLIGFIIVGSLIINSLKIIGKHM
jgi:hypothetical protein